MHTTHDPETQTRQEIEQAELRLHRLYETHDRAPADEKAVVESQIEEAKLTIERLKAQLHH
jgi:hypothetical protein